jgi:hypothetical protein
MHSLALVVGNGCETGRGVVGCAKDSSGGVLCYLQAEDVQVGEEVDEGIRKIIVGTKV